MNYELDLFKSLPKLTQKSVCGTSYHGIYITTTCGKLKKIMGEPNGGGCSKVQRSWDCELPTGEVFTIYDWKEYRTIEEETIVDYHIGGFDKEVTIKAKRLLLKVLEK